MKVLIVDDSPEALAIAKVRLEKENLEEILCARDGEEGLEMARQHCPDLILLDVDMPNLNGFDVCRILQRDVELHTIPIIFVTAFSKLEDRIKGLDLGAVDYVTKPFDAFELRARVRAALRTKQLQDMLINSANMDPLTELPNRRTLIEHLGQEWARAQRYGSVFSVIMADIDLFKRINDTYGHTIGDKVLKQVARTFTEQCRKLDLPTRYGGEEFAIIVPNEPRHKAAILAERFRSKIENLSMRIEENTIQITVSFGVADSSTSTSEENLIHTADEALYRAKQEGRNRVAIADVSNVEISS